MASQPIQHATTPRESKLERPSLVESSDPRTILSSYLSPKPRTAPVSSTEAPQEPSSDQANQHFKPIDSNSGTIPPPPIRIPYNPPPPSSPKRSAHPQTTFLHIPRPHHMVGEQQHQMASPVPLRAHRCARIGTDPSPPKTHPRSSDNAILPSRTSPSSTVRSE